jgi:hypothetical protein
MLFVTNGETIMRLIDRRGEKYTRLTVIERVPNASKTDTNARWLCKCDCGKTVIAYGQDLAKGKFKSCGCLNAERIRKHGMARTKVYQVWKSMKSRCDNPNEQSYPNYGGRGIAYDPSWADFENFYRDMGDPPKGGKKGGKITIDRVNNEGPYCKANCEWKTLKDNLNNKRDNVTITALGQTLTYAQWAERLGVSWSCIRDRYERYGWPAEATVSLPPQMGTALKHRS